MANPMLIQKQIKDNADDLHNFVRDLKLWEEEMKRKDRQLSTDQNNEELLPPVRKAKLSSKTPQKTEILNGNKGKRIPSSDYKSWDKFDVEKACEDLDKEQNDNIQVDEDSTEQNEKYMKEKALYEKELGNQHVKVGKWDAAVEAYTRAILAYPKDPIFYANRALCYLKKKKWENVETDCTEALKLDSTYVKAYLRRAVAREALGRLEDTKHDLSQVLRLEPGNTQAYRDLQRLKESGVKKKEGIKESEQSTNQKSDGIKECSSSKLNTNLQRNKKIKKDDLNQAASSAQLKSPVSSEPNWAPSSSTILPISKPPHLRSKKSLKRIEIHEIGLNSPKHVYERKVCQLQEVPLNTHEPVNVKNEIPNETPAVGKPRSILTLARSRDVPPPPKTSVQFHKSWSAIKDDRHLCYQFLKQIPGEELADIFKESLESRMFSRILETLALECGSDEVVLPYLWGLTRVRRFSTLALFLSPADKSNLSKLFEHCIKRGDCSPRDVEDLRRVYEM